MLSHKAAEIFLKAENVALFCHTKPDPDTIGSALALRHALVKKGKNVAIFCDTPLKGRLSFVEGYETIRQEFYGKYDLHAALDCGDSLRMGELYEAFFRCKNTVNIDHHHLSNDKFARFNWVENKASVCQMVLEIVHAMGVEVDKTIADAVMSGIVTDTNCFSNTNTDKAVLDAAGELIDKVDINTLNFRLRRNTTYNRVKLMGRALSGAKLYFGGKVVILSVKDADYEATGTVMSDSEGFVDEGLNIEGVKAAVCVVQASHNSFKVSMRGKDNTDVCSVCKSFGGGGHRVAAGCTICGFYEDIVDKLIRAFEIELGFER